MASAIVLFRWAIDRRDTLGKRVRRNLGITIQLEAGIAGSLLVLAWLTVVHYNAVGLLIWFPIVLSVLWFGTESALAGRLDTMSPAATYLARFFKRTRFGAWLHRQWEGPIRDTKFLKPLYRFGRWLVGAADSDPRPTGNAQRMPITDSPDPTPTGGSQPERRQRGIVGIALVVLTGLLANAFLSALGAAAERGGSPATSTSTTTPPTTTPPTTTPPTTTSVPGTKTVLQAPRTTSTTKPTADYFDICPAIDWVIPGYQAPDWALRQSRHDNGEIIELAAIYLLYFQENVGPGVPVAGCVGPPVTLTDSFDTVSYQLGYDADVRDKDAPDVIVSVAVSSMNHGDVLFRGEAADYAAQLLKAGHTVSGSPRYSTTYGDIQLLVSAEGTAVFILNAHDAGTTVITPTVTEAWFAVMRTEGWLWPRFIGSGIWVLSRDSDGTEVGEIAVVSGRTYFTSGSGVRTEITAIPTIHSLEELYQFHLPPKR